jgi:hypothetical protein
MSSVPRLGTFFETIFSKRCKLFESFELDESQTSFRKRHCDKLKRHVISWLYHLIASNFKVIIFFSFFGSWVNLCWKFIPLAWKWPPCSSRWVEGAEWTLPRARLWSEWAGQQKGGAVQYRAPPSSAGCTPSLSRGKYGTHGPYFLKIECISLEEAGTRDQGE